MYPAAGAFLAADRQIDPKTGTIRISAIVSQPAAACCGPGSTDASRAETQMVEDALLVPQRAVTELQGASQLRVVGADDKVQLAAR